MGEFDYKKFLIENKLTYSSREVAFNKLNENLNKSDFEVGLIYLREMGYNVSKESLNEIKFPSWISNFGKNIKSKVLNKINKIKSKREAEKELKKVLDQIKLYSTVEQWEKIKNANLKKDIPKIIPKEPAEEPEA